MEKIVNGKQYGYEGDFVLRELTAGRYIDYQDDLGKANIEVYGSQVSANIKLGTMMMVRIKHAVVESPMPMTDENIRSLPTALFKELHKVAVEVISADLPFGGMTSEETPGQNSKPLSLE